MIGQIYSHNLLVLVRIAGLQAALDAEARADLTFDDHWDKVLRWSEQSRYEKRSAIEADRLIRAIADPSHGVLQWLRRHW